MASLPSSSSTFPRKYDVYLSFRGLDTRRNFTAHLYEALSLAGIRTYRDDEELKRGEIVVSRFAIIIFSRNYALSTWCLEELAHIMRCKETGGLTVIPVFYGVDPSGVYNQKNSFEEAFARHEERFRDDMYRVQSWRSALREAASLWGWILLDRDESLLIDDIVKDLLVQLNGQKVVSSAIYPVGLDSRANKVISLLIDEAFDVSIVGIYGMGGIGKTAVAKEVYNLISQEFVGSCFLENVSQASNAEDVVRLQNQLLSEILRSEYEKIPNVSRGSKVIQERLKSMRVLIVLDNVDERKQLNNLLGNCDWLLRGSRILITTRTKDLVTSEAYRQYEANTLDDAESLFLLAKNAFQKFQPSSPSKSFNLPHLPRKYDVYLSFRGKETRRNFTAHLYKALSLAGIRTHRGDEELKRGENIWSSLREGIEGSRFAIIIFSRNYASSAWCLDELAYIMKCKETGDMTVIPVFYGVDPSDVRYQKNSFKEAFARHEERFRDDMYRVQSWRSALREATDLAGYVSRDGDESFFIDDIVKGLLVQLKRQKLVSSAIYPVGLDSRANKVISLLVDKAFDASIVGIYGMGGIGKTAVAKEVYNLISQEFEGSCYLENVGQASNAEDVVRLQNQLLSEILRREYEKIPNVSRGSQVIEERLQSMRVLIVLDNVDERKQLNNLLGDCGWLFRGSRIIITTRTKDLVTSEAYRQYEANKLDDAESLFLLAKNAFEKFQLADNLEEDTRLFTKHALKKAYLPDEYMECAKRVVHYARGIPLALELFGSRCCGESVQVWENELEKLKVYPDETLQQTLEISYKSLCRTEKDIFLDIACFFIGKDKDFVLGILDGFFPVTGIRSLIKKCLIKVDYNNKLVMHDLIRDMGRDVVRKECDREPGKRSRVWRNKEAFELLRDNAGTKEVEGLSLDLPGSSKLFSRAFKEMTRLRLLALNRQNIKGSCKHISKELKWLCWCDFPLESIPVDLHLENVVALDMRNSSLKVLGELKNLRKLKFLNLSHSSKLMETPDFQELTGLVILKLKDCPCLVEVHESIGLLNKLVTLNLKDCKNLVTLPERICNLRSLENLNISGCSRIDELPEDTGNMQSLVVFDASRTAIRKIPASFSLLPKLTYHGLNDCKRLEEILGGVPKSLVTLEAKDCIALEGMNLQTLMKRDP